MQLRAGDYPEVVVIGAASIDIKGKIFGALRPGSSSPGEVRISLGGSARNMAENLGRLGVRTALLSAVGVDSFGHMIRDRTAASGVDVSRTIISTAHPSATYVAVIDSSGIPHLGVDDMAVIAAITPDYVLEQRELIRRAKIVAIDANLAPETLQEVFGLAQRHHTRVCANPVSVTLANRLKPHLRDCFIITPNVAEAEVLTGMKIRDRATGPLEVTQHMVASGVGLAIITLGEEGVAYSSTEGSGHVPAVRCEVIDRTGAGDALTAAVVYGVVSGFPVDESLHLGVSAATMALSSKDTVNPDLSLENLYQALAV